MPKSRDSRMAMNGRWIFHIGTAALTGLTLSGCASETASRFLVEPDRFVLYNCIELATQAQANVTRQRELEVLMAKAGSGGGQVASAMAYQPEYLQLRGEMTQLQKAAVEKHCKPLPSAPASGGTSSGAIR